MSGLGSLTGLTGSAGGLGSLSGMGGGGLGSLAGLDGNAGSTGGLDAGAGSGSGLSGALDGGSLSGDSASGVSAVDPAAGTSGSFANVLKDVIVNNPTNAQNQADSLAALSAAGGDVDPGTLAVDSAKASIDVQMSTSTISQAVSAVRTLMQLQI